MGPSGRDRADVDNRSNRSPGRVVIRLFDHAAGHGLTDTHCGQRVLLQQLLKTVVKFPSIFIISASRAGGAPSDIYFVKSHLGVRCESVETGFEAHCMLHVAAP